MTEILRNSKTFKKCQKMIAKSYTYDDMSKHNCKTLINNAQDIIKLCPNYYYGYYALGVGYECVGKYNSAKKMLKRAIANNSKSSASYDCLAYVYQVQRKFAYSLRTEQKAIRLDPHRALNYNSLGVIYSYLGEYNLALRFHKKIEKAGHKYPVIYFNIGIDEGNLENYVQGIKYLRKATKLDRCYGDVFNTLGVYYSDLGKYKLALKYYKKAKRWGYRGYKEPVIYDNMGITYMHLNHYFKACWNADWAVIFCPTNSDYYKDLAEVYHKFNSDKTAKEIIHDAIWHHKDNNSLIAKLARVDYDLGKYKSSIRYSLLAIKLGYKGTYPNETIAMDYNAMGKHTAAKTIYRCIIKSNANHKSNKFYYRLARLGFDIGDSSASIKFINKYINNLYKSDDLDNDYCQLSYQLLGRNYFTLNRYEDSKKAFRKATILRRNGDNLYYLAHVECCLGQYQDGLSHIREAIKLQPQNNSNYWLLGCIYEDINDYSNAKQADEQAVRLCPTDVVNLFDLAHVERKMGQSSLALRHIKKLIKLQPKNGTNNQLLGEIYMDMDQYKKSIKAFKRSIDFGNSTNVDVYMDLAIDYNNINIKYSTIAEKYSSMAVAVDPQDSEALRNLGIDMWNVGDNNGLNYVRKAIAISPNDYRGYVSLAIFYLIMHKMDMYMKYIKIAKNLDKVGCLQMLNNSNIVNK